MGWNLGCVLPTTMTSTLNVRRAMAWSGSVAVTEISVSPYSTAMTVSMLSDTVAVATAVSSGVAVNVRASPSASEKYPDRSKSLEVPRSIVWLEMLLLTVGARLGGSSTGAATVTVKLCDALPSSSLAVAVAVTNTVAVPAPIGVTVTTFPEAFAVATVGLSELAVYLRLVPSK